MHKSTRVGISVSLACVFATVTACSNDDPHFQACAHDDREVASTGASDYVLHTEETVCDDIAHSDSVLLYLARRGDNKRIRVLEYIPAMTRDEPRATWVSPETLRIDFRAVEEVLKSYDVDAPSVRIYYVNPPRTSSFFDWFEIAYEAFVGTLKSRK